MTGYARLLWVLLVLVLVLSGVSLSLGPAKIGFAEAFHALGAGEGSMEAAILWQIRLPRLLLGLLVGGSLGLSGAALQGLLRNPLAERGSLAYRQVPDLARYWRFIFPLQA